jgi:DNA-binding MarR family transcriptional regulator
MSNSVDDPTQKPQQDSLNSPIPYAKPPEEWLRLPISLSAYKVLVALDQYQGEKLQNQVGLEFLATKIELSTRTIRRAIDDLVALGVVTRRPTWRTNVYAVTNPARKRSNRTQVTKQEDIYDTPIGHRWPPDTEIKQTKKTNKQVTALAEVLAKALTAGCPAGVSITPNELLETKAQLIKNQGLNPHEVAKQAVSHTKANTSVRDFGSYLVTTALEKALRGDLDPSKLYAPTLQPDDFETVQRKQKELWRQEEARNHQKWVESWSNLDTNLVEP